MAVNAGRRPRPRIRWGAYWGMGMNYAPNPRGFDGRQAPDAIEVWQYQDWGTRQFRWAARCPIAGVDTVQTCDHLTARRAKRALVRMLMRDFSGLDWG